MRRLHLFEFGDLPWFPRILHDAETAYLAASYKLFPDFARSWAQIISTQFTPGQPAEILDLCAGSGGAMPGIIEDLENRGYEPRATLTDLYPNPQSVSHSSMHWLTGPVDATRVPPDLAGVRTMFSAFHHFRPHAAKAILEDAFNRRRPICIFESGQGTLVGCLNMLGVPLAVLLMMPFTRPFRLGYAVFTYLIPLLPLILLWDGMVSMLRIYSPEQMRQLTKDLQAPDYSWEAGRIRIRRIPGGLPYLVGRPLSLSR